MEAAPTDDAANRRLERIIRETAEHCGSMAPAIIAFSRHVIKNVDGTATGFDVCRCLPARGRD